MKSLQVDKETCLASNKSLAEYNLSRESKFTQAKQQLASTYEQAIKIQKQFDEHKQKLREDPIFLVTSFVFCVCFEITLWKSN